jgi:hypothetical protein
MYGLKPVPFTSGAKQAAEKLERMGKSGGEHSSGAEARVVLIELVPGMNPRPAAPVLFNRGRKRFAMKVVQTGESSMRNRIVGVVFAAVMMAAPVLAQNEQLPAPSPVEKELAARASDVTEVTLGKNMLAFAAKVMNGKNDDDAETRRLIEGLQGIYVREYEFDKPGEYSPDEVDQLRKYFETSEWSPVVKERERKSGESTDVMVKLVNGESHGIFILSTEPKELTIVLILGPIKMDDLGKLKGVGGLSVLGDIAKDTDGKDKAKDKDKKGGNQ